MPAVRSVSIGTYTVRVRWKAFLKDLLYSIEEGKELSFMHFFKTKISIVAMVQKAKNIHRRHEH